VPNGSFEEYKKLPKNTFRNEVDGIENYVMSWSNPNIKTTPDYYIDKGQIANIKLPDFFFPNSPVLNSDSLHVKIPSFSGIGFTGIGNSFAFNTDFGGYHYYAEYLRNSLSKMLIKNVKYTGSFYYFSIGDPSLVINGLGMLMTQGQNIESKDSFFLNYFGDDNNPQITDKNLIRSTGNWQNIKGNFKAKGGEKNLTIGYFKRSNNIEILDSTLVKFNTWGQALFNNYFFIDSVTVYEIKGIVAPDTACKGEKTMFYSNANGTFLWATDRQAKNILSTDSIYNFIADSSRWYYLFSDEGLDSTFLTVIDYPILNLGNDTAFCQGKEIILSAISSTIPLWFNYVPSNSFIANKQCFYWATAANYGCLVTDSIFVTQHPNPGLLPNHFAQICTADNGLYELNLINKNKYLWYFDNDSSANKIFTKEGCFAVKISNEFGCAINDSICITDLCKPYIQVPNAFIPNGVNKTFKPITKFVDEINWEIYNRYGEKVFFTNSLTSEWDGTFNNNPCQGDVYFYIINYAGKQNNNETKTIKGTITLIR
jgi:gliding motility-associated-like protein